MIVRLDSSYLDDPFLIIIGLRLNVPYGGVIQKDQIEWFKEGFRTAAKDKVLIVSVYHVPFSTGEDSASIVILQTAIKI